MDMTLLVGTKGITKNPASYGRLAFAALAGGAFAVLYPLLGIGNVWLQTGVKLLGGVAVCAIGGRFSGAGGFIKFTLIFLALTALVGGALVALFALAGAQYVAGQGYALSSVPIGIPLFCGMLIVLAVRKVAARFTRTHSVNVVKCRIVVGERCAEVEGFFDSGNKVHYRGVPVSVAPRAVAEKLTDVARIQSCVAIHTVSGRAMLPVFWADSVRIDYGTYSKTYSKVLLGVSPSYIEKLVLSPDITEV